MWETVWLGDLPVAALTPPAGRFYIAPDHQGSPHLITAAGGALAWLWTHDPFGNGDPLGGPYDLRFPGQYFDQATKLHYNYFRDYDPRTGRYIESDPKGLWGGVNTYAYVGGNPIWAFDPFGLYGTQSCDFWQQTCAAGGYNNPYACGLAPWMCSHWPIGPWGDCVRQCLQDFYQSELPFPGVCKPNNYVPSRPIVTNHIDCWLGCAEDPADPVSVGPN